MTVDYRILNKAKLYHYINGFLLTSNSLEALGKAVDSLTTHLQKKGWLTTGHLKSLRATKGLISLAKFWAE